MSISRKNWSALSSLTRQWTMEDEEEVEREKRRRVRGSNSTADPDADFSPTAGDTSTSDSTSETNSTSEMSEELSSTEQMNQDFVEMLRVRDEKRRRRHVEALRRQKELEEEQGGVFSPVTTASKPQPLLNTASHSTSSNAACTQHENGESSRKDPEPTPSSNQNRTFVSSVSISLDKGPSTSRCSTPMSPRSPTTPSSSEDRWPSPCQSPSLSGPWSPVHNGHRSKENGSSPDCNFEQTTKPAFVRQSSRTVSFRMMRKKEEESAPLQRSASVRAASKKFESNTYQSEEEDKASTFQRNSKQRISSRSIQEKMERLAQAAQKSEMIRSPDVTQRTLFRMDEVSRKRDLFEKEQQAASPTSPGVSRQEFRSFTSGMSDRINRWINKAKQTGSSHSPVDLRHVDITSKKSLFESSGEENPSSGMPMM